MKRLRLQIARVVESMGMLVPEGPAVSSFRQISLFLVDDDWLLIARHLKEMLQYRSEEVQGANSTKRLLSQHIFSIYVLPPLHTIRHILTLKVVSMS